MDNHPPLGTPPSNQTIQCFLCGQSLIYRGNRFCGDRCRATFDAGYSRLDPNQTCAFCALPRPSVTHRRWIASNGDEPLHRRRGTRVRIEFPAARAKHAPASGGQIAAGLSHSVVPCRAPPVATRRGH
jgi:hypothetical protein